MMYHFDNIATEYDTYKARYGGLYHSRLQAWYRYHIPPMKDVLELGCGTGDILASVYPRVGVGVDLSHEMVAQARNKYRYLSFIWSDAETYYTLSKYDAVILCDMLEHTQNHAAVIDTARRHLKPGGNLLITTVKPLWAPVLWVLEKLHLKMPEGSHWWPPIRYLEYLCKSKGFDVKRESVLPFIAGLVCNNSRLRQP